MGAIVKRPNRPKPWLVRFRGPDGREISKAFQRKIDAERWLAEQETDRGRGLWVDPRSGRATFGEQAQRWRDSRHGLRPTTLARDDQVMKTLVLPTFAARSLASITSEQIEKWIAGLVAKGYSPSTVHKAAQLVSGVLRSAVRARRLAVNPAADVSLPTIERPERAFLTADEIVRLADAIDPRYRGMVLLGGFAGLRLGEVAALRGSSFGLGMRSVTVTETVSEVRGEVFIGPPKTRASIRTVALPASWPTNWHPEVPKKRDHVVTKTSWFSLRRRAARSARGAGGVDSGRRR
jgi:integrase